MITDISTTRWPNCSRKHFSWSLTGENCLTTTPRTTDVHGLYTSKYYIRDLWVQHSCYQYPQHRFFTHTWPILKTATRPCGCGYTDTLHVVVSSGSSDQPTRTQPVKRLSHSRAQVGFIHSWYLYSGLQENRLRGALSPATTDLRD